MNIINKLEITNFRCHDKFILNIKNPTTLIIGENGSGKTSLIEALHISLQGKSFKSSDDNILKTGKSYYKINTCFYNNQQRQIIYKKDQKKEFKINDKKYLRLSKNTKYPVVLFEPDDLNLIHNSPGSRRNYIDKLISQFDESYNQAIKKYQKALKQRNSIFKNQIPTLEKLFPWNIILAKYGCEIILKRNHYINEINNKINDIYYSIASIKDNVILKYSHAIINESDYLNKLVNSFNKDQLLYSTSFGPHRDDVIFNFNNKTAVDTASRGEIRTIILSLKFIEAELIRDNLNQNPVILLDDIFSELDESRQSKLITNFKDHQVIITSTSTPLNMKVDKKL